MSSHVSLICYVGNGVVKAAVVRADTKNPCNILSTRIRQLPYQEFIDRDHLEFRIMKEFTELIKDVKFKDLAALGLTGASFKDAFIILSSPWYVSETRIIKIDQAKPFVITDKLVKGAVSEVIAEYADRQKNNIAILEQRTIRYVLNGYPSTAPLKKTVSHLEINFFLSFGKQEHLSAFKSTVLSHFHISNVQIHSQSYVAFTVLQDIWKDTPNYVLTDISSELTELMIVRNHALSEAISFPFGKQFIVRELGKRLHTSGEISQSLLALYREKGADEELKSKISEALNQIRQDWLVQFTKALGDMSAGVSLPSRFMLLAPHDSEWLFADFIRSEEYHQFTFSEGKFEVFEMKISDFDVFSCTNESVQRDLSLSLASSFYQKNILGV